MQLATVQLQLEGPQFGMGSPVAPTLYPATPEPSPQPAVFPFAAGLQGGGPWPKAPSPMALSRYGSAVVQQYPAGEGSAQYGVVGVRLYGNRVVDVVPGTNVIVGRMDVLRDDELPTVIISTPQSLGGSGPFYRDNYYDV